MKVILNEFKYCIIVIELRAENSSRSIRLTILDRFIKYVPKNSESSTVTPILHVLRVKILPHRKFHRTNMSRPIIKFYSKFIHLLGLNNNSRPPYRSAINLLFLTWSLTQLIVSAARNTDNLYSFIFPFSYSTICILLIINLLVLMRETEQVHLLLQCIDRNVHAYENESRITPTYDWIEDETNMLRAFAFLWCYNACICVLMALIPLVQYLLVGNVKILVYPGWIPWSTDRPFSFACTYMIHVSVLGIAAVLYNLSCTLPLCVTFEFRRQCKRLNAALLLVFDESAYEVSRRHDKTAKLNDLVSCVRHHQALVK